MHTISADYSGYDIYDPSSGTLSQRITLAPTVSAGPDQTADEGSIVSFSGSFNDPALLRPQAGELLQWDFGDGTTVTGTLVPTHTFGDNGLFTVTLAVTDTDGLAGLDSLQVTVTNVAPSVNAGIYTPTLTNQPLTFAGSFTDPGWLDTHTFLWDFGDGATASGSLTPSHTFLNPGVYTVTLTVTDDDGGVGSDSALVEVVTSQVVYDPGDNPGSEWSNPLTTTAPCTATFIGEFGNEVVTLTLKDLPAHSQAAVSFDLYIIRSWDGNAINWPPELASKVFAPEGIVGPDLWSLRVNGDTLLQTTFSNWENPGLMQAFPGSYPGGSYPGQSGASQVNTLCYNFFQFPMDATYPMSFTFDHSGDTLTVDFAALGLSAITDESWGLDNIKVTVSGAGQLLHKVYLPVIGN